MSSNAARGGAAQLAVTGMGVSTAFGRGAGPMLDAISRGQSAFGQSTRFDTRRCRVGVAAELPGDPKLGLELGGVIDQACEQAGLAPADRAETDLFMALHTD